MREFSSPPGYRRAPSAISPTLAPFAGVIDAILETDKKVHVKRRHTTIRIRDWWLRDEYGYTSGYTFIHEYVHGIAMRQNEVHATGAHRAGMHRSILAKPMGSLLASKVRFHYFCLDMPPA